MQEIDDLYIENDKTNAPFLLAASFSGIVKFVGTKIQDNVLYWQFSPKATSCSTFVNS